jgi:hypothetical protein
MLNVESNEYKYILVFMFFEKNYSKLILNDNNINISIKEKDFTFFIEFIEKSIILKNHFNNYMDFLIKKYENNRFVQKIINLYMEIIIDSLKYEYLSRLVKSMKIDNNLSLLESYKIFKINILESFRKDNVHIKNMNININIHEEFNKYYVNKNENFLDHVDKYYDVKFYDFKILFLVFIKTIYFSNFCKNLKLLINDVIYPNIKNSV